MASSLAQLAGSETSSSASTSYGIHAAPASAPADAAFPLPYSPACDTLVLIYLLHACASVFSDIQASGYLLLIIWRMHLEVIALSSFLT